MVKLLILSAAAAIAAQAAAPGAQSMIEPSGDVSPVCWKLMSILGTVIVAIAAYVVKLHSSISEIQASRIADLKETNDLADTLLDVLIKERPKNGGT